MSVLWAHVPSSGEVLRDAILRVLDQPGIVDRNDGYNDFGEACVLVLRLLRADGWDGYVAASTWED